MDGLYGSFREAWPALVFALGEAQDSTQSLLITFPLPASRTIRDVSGEKFGRAFAEGFPTTAVPQLSISSARITQKH
jgi:hypothetical protein